MGIVLKNVSFKYKNSREYAIKNINLEIKNNEMIGLFGEVASGKTTLLKIMGGMLFPYGSVIINKKVGYIGFDSNIFKITHMTYTLLELLDNRNINRIKSAMKMLFLNENILSRKLYTLTESEKLLFQISLVLSKNPDIILFDDLFGVLDYKNKKNIIRLIRMLKLKYNKTIIVCSNDIDILYEICDKLIILSSAKLIAFDKCENIFKNEMIVNEMGISIPKISYFKNEALKKNIKIMDVRCINDLIKEVYRNE